MRFVAVPVGRVRRPAPVKGGVGALEEDDESGLGPGRLGRAEVGVHEAPLKHLPEDAGVPGEGRLEEEGRRGRGGALRSDEEAVRAYTRRVP